MPSRRKSTTKPRASAKPSIMRVDYVTNMTPKRRAKIPREALDDAAPPIPDSVLIDPNSNSLWRYLDEERNGSPSQTSSASDSFSTGASGGRRRGNASSSRTTRSHELSDLPPSPKKRCLVNPNFTFMSRPDYTGSPTPLPTPKPEPRSSSPQDTPHVFCWKCHKSANVLSCIKCVRGFHSACLNGMGFRNPNSRTAEKDDGDWHCPICVDLESDSSGIMSKWQSSSAYEIQLKKALAFLVDYLSIQQWAVPFREAGDSDEAFCGSCPTKDPMDLRKLLQRVNEDRYKTTGAFMDDFVRIIHTTVVSQRRTTQSSSPTPSQAPLCDKARSLDKLCVREIELLRSCPTCYLARASMPSILSCLPSTAMVSTEISRCEPRIYQRPVVRRERPSEQYPTWMVQACSVVHPLVWVAYEHGLWWPGKVMAQLSNSTLLVSFFGNYSVRTVPANFVILHSGGPTPPTVVASLTDRLKRSDMVEPRDEMTHRRACEELRRHLLSLHSNFPNFELPDITARDFSSANVEKYYGPFSKWSIEAQRASPSNESEEANSSAAVSPGPTGDEVPTRSSLSSSSLPSSVLLASNATTTPSTTTATATQGSTSSSSSNDSHLPEPLFTRLSSGRGLVSFMRCQSPPLQSSVSSSTQTQQLRSLPASEATDAEGRIVLQNGTEPQVDQPLGDESTDIHETETIPATESTTSTLPGNNPDGVPHMDLITHLQDSRDALCSQVQTIIDRTFQNLELSVADSCALTQAAGAAVPKCEVGTDVMLLPVADACTQTELSTSGQSGRIALLELEIHRLDRTIETLKEELERTRLEAERSSAESLRERHVVDVATNKSIIDAFQAKATKVIAEVKKRQWCAYCGKQAYFYCCWNTSYCNGTCQKYHWPEHLRSCTHPKGQGTAQDQVQQSMQALQCQQQTH